MDELKDIIIIGAGPAGLSAAVTATARNRSVMLISGDHRDTGLYKSKLVDNYLGLPGVSGAELLKAFRDHAEMAGVEPVTGRVLGVMPMDGRFMVSFGSDVAMARAVVIATGVVRTNLFPGEEEYLGRGVSYCATCDGMLYRGKKVCVVGLSSDAEAEARYLGDIGCELTYIPQDRAVNVRIHGNEVVTGLEAGGELHQCEGVFILRNGVSPATFMPELVIENGHIKVDAKMQTSVPGVFAAGDCVGAPYQINKAAGEGQKAVLSAVELWLG